jgi:hypothetical protein
LVAVGVGVPLVEVGAGVFVAVGVLVGVGVFVAVGVLVGVGAGSTVAQSLLNVQVLVPVLM